jgi:hypothetical protein
MKIVFCFILCLLLQTKCRLYFLSSSNGWADVSMPITTVDSSCDEQMMSAHPSLLGAIVAMGIFGPSLLSSHCSDALVATDRLPMATVTYGLLLQCLVIVVWIVCIGNRATIFKQNLLSNRQNITNKARKCFVNLSGGRSSQESQGNWHVLSSIKRRWDASIESKMAMQNSNELVFSLLIIWSFIYTCLGNHLEVCIAQVFATFQRRPFEVFTLFGVILSVISVIGHL